MDFCSGFQFSAQLWLGLIHQDPTPFNWKHWVVLPSHIPGAFPAFGYSSHHLMELLRLEKTFRITKHKSSPLNCVLKSHIHTDFEQFQGFHHFPGQVLHRNHPLECCFFGNGVSTNSLGRFSMGVTLWSVGFLPVLPVLPVPPPLQPLLPSPCQVTLGAAIWG